MTTTRLPRLADLIRRTPSVDPPPAAPVAAPAAGRGAPAPDPAAFVGRRAPAVPAPPLVEATAMVETAPPPAARRGRIEGPFPQSARRLPVEQPPPERPPAPRRVEALRQVQRPPVPEPVPAAIPPRPAPPVAPIAAAEAPPAASTMALPAAVAEPASFAATETAPAAVTEALPRVVTEAAPPAATETVPLAETETAPSLATTETIRLAAEEPIPPEATEAGPPEATEAGPPAAAEPVTLAAAEAPTSEANPLPATPVAPPPTTEAIASSRTAFLPETEVVSTVVVPLPEPEAAPPAATRRLPVPDLEVLPPPAAAATPLAAPPETAIRRERPRFAPVLAPAPADVDARRVYENAEGWIASVLDAARNGEIDGADVRESVRTIAGRPALLERLFAETFRERAASESPARGALNAAVYALRLGAALGYDEETLVDVGTAALLRGIGLVDDAVAALGTRFSRASDIVLHAAERCDGSGPRRLREPDVPEPALVVGLAEVFEGLAGARPDHPRTSPFVAVKEVLEKERSHFSRKLLRQFFVTFSGFPPFTYVRLSSNAIARVVATEPGHPLRPVVVVVRERDGSRPAAETPLRLVEQPLLHITGPVAESQA